MLKPAEIEALAAAAPGVRFEPAGPAYLEEPRGRVRMAAAVLALPEDVGQVASVVRACGRLRYGLVPRGGGTGLVLGQVVPGGPAPVILSLERMARVRGIWPEENVMTVEAGAILADVQRAAAEAGRLFPLALAAQGSARIGGNLATNAGGVTVLRYGNARDLCLGIEAVLPDGSVMAGLTRLRKDNTGYDLRHLLIGSEGTLGVITAAALKLAPMPAARATAVFVVADPAAALALLALAEARAAGLVSAFELIGGQGLRFLDEILPEVRQPFAARPDWMVLIELGLPAGVAPAAMMEADLIEAAATEGLIGDGVIARPRRSVATSGGCARPSPRPTGASAPSPRAMTSRCRLARWPGSSPAPGRRWRRWGTCGSTALAISATATCITMSFRRRAGSGRDYAGRAGAIKTAGA